MLILSRKVNENIVIDGRIIVKIVRLDGDNVKLGIEAPADVPVHRQEVYDEIQRSNREAANQGRPPVPRISKAKTSSSSNAGASGQGGASQNSPPGKGGPVPGTGSGTPPPA